MGGDPKPLTTLSSAALETMHQMDAYKLYLYVPSSGWKQVCSQIPTHKKKRKHVFFFLNLDTKVYPKHESKQLLKTNVSIDMQKECIHFG